VHNTNNLEQFKSHIELVIDTLKLHEKALVALVEDWLTTLFSSEYTTEILTAAVFQLAEIDLYTCRWALRNFYNLKLHRDITEELLCSLPKN